MRNVWQAVLCCCILGGLHTSASASTFNVSFTYEDFGEAVYQFDGIFDDGVFESGSGTLQFMPIESTLPPSVTNLSNLDIELVTTELYGIPAYAVSFQNLPFQMATFPMYFFDTPSGFVFDPFDSPLLDAAALTSAGSFSVPLPSSAPLFGAALLAFGALGYGVKRRSRSLAL